MNKIDSTFDQSWIPSFTAMWNGYWKNPTKPESFTTLLNINREQRFVTKAYLPNRLIDALVTNNPVASPEKTNREASMLKLLNRLGVPSPTFLGISSDRSVFVMEFIKGDNLINSMNNGQFTNDVIGKLASLIWDTHCILARISDEVKQTFVPYPGHTGNINNLLDETFNRVNDRSWALEMTISAKRKFQEYTKVLKQRFRHNKSYNECNEAIYGDLAVNNIMLEPGGRLVLIDPILSMGKRSMDLGRLGRSMFFRKETKVCKIFLEIVNKYNQLAKNQRVSVEEILDMMSVDLLRTLSLFWNIPEEELGKFPDYIKRSSRDNLDLYLDVLIPKFLEYKI